jgi:outer membrane lipoprotein-sorting protein
MRIWLFSLLWCLLIIGCAAVPALPPETPFPEVILNQMRTHGQSLEGCKGLAQMKVAAAGKSFQAQQVIFARLPGWLRAESLGLLGTPQFYFVTDGRELNLYHPGENKYYRGRATANHLSLVLPITLDPEEIVSLLLGKPVLLDYDVASLRRNEEEGLWTLELASTPRKERQVLWIHPASLHILRAELYRPALSQRLVFEDFRRIQGLLFPQKIQFTSFEPAARLALEYLDVELNPSWKPEDFQLPVPRGATILPLP